MMTGNVTQMVIDSLDWTTITTVETKSFSGHTYPEILDVFPNKEILERTSMNSWDDQKIRDALARNGKKKVILADLWTEVRNTPFALCAMLEGDYEIYMVADDSGDIIEGRARLRNAAHAPGRRGAGHLAAGLARHSDYFATERRGAMALAVRPFGQDCKMAPRN